MKYYSGKFLLSQKSNINIVALFTLFFFHSSLYAGKIDNCIISDSLENCQLSSKSKNYIPNFKLDEFKYFNQSSHRNNQIEFCLPEEKPEDGFCEALFDTETDAWDKTKSWIYENPKKLVAAGVTGIISSWKIKKWFLDKTTKDPLEETGNKRPPYSYNGWFDRDKKKVGSKIPQNFPSSFTKRDLSSEFPLVLLSRENPFNDLKQSGVEKSRTQLTQDFPSNFSFTERRIETNLNLNYEYEDRDIYALLVLRTQEAGLDLTRTVIMAPLDNMGNTLNEQLLEERRRYRNDVLAQTIIAAPRIVMVPINLNNLHWVGLVIKLDDRNRAQSIQYIDPLSLSFFEEDIPIEIRRALRIVYGDIYIENLMILRQTDRTSCGALTVENLILAAQNKLRTVIADSETTREIREHHVNLLERFRPDLRFNFRQENDISDWSTRKFLKSSLTSQFRDLELADAVLNSPDFLLPIFLRTADKLVSTNKEKASNLITNPIFQQLIAIQTNSPEVEKLKVEFLTRIDAILHGKVKCEEETNKEHSEVRLNDFVTLFITALKCLCASESTVVAEDEDAEEKFILSFKKIISHTVTKIPYLTHSLVIEFDNSIKKHRLMFALELTEVLLKLFMTNNDRLMLIPYPVFYSAEKKEKVIRVRYDISILPKSKPIFVEDLLNSTTLPSSLKGRLQRMHFENTDKNQPETPSVRRKISQIRLKFLPPFPFDSRFANYNANFIYKKNGLHIAVGEGPEDEESFLRLLSDLTSLHSEFPNKKKVIIALGNLTPGKDFIPYYEVDKTYSDGKHEYIVTTTPILEIQSSNISGYSLRVNDSEDFLVLHIRMPEYKILESDETDLELLYDHVYCRNEGIILFHCRAGMGRSASFAILMKLLKEWGSLFKEGIDANTFIRHLQHAYWEIRLKRPIEPNYDQFEKIFKILLYYIKTYQNK